MIQEEYIKTYPIQFRDKIDEYLWKEHHILGGCCSSIESMKYAVAREVAEKLTDVFIAKVCERLEKNIAELTGIDSYAITEVFKQAMEE